MISLLLTALLCAYSFSATAAEGKTPADNLAKGPNGNTVLHIIALPKADRDALLTDHTLKSLDDKALAQVALSLIEQRADVSAENDEEAMPIDFADKNKKNAPHVFEVLDASFKLLVLNKREQDGKPNRGKPIDRATQMERLAPYRTQPSTTGN